MNFRSLRFIRRPLGPLQILVGSNACGKTTFLDVLSFLGALATRGLQDAFRERSQTPIDLLWQRQPGRMVTHRRALHPGENAYLKEISATR
ncbi:MAG: hypothetical protein JNL98_09280 [Bryobacterales bacterium]|nr:hypothetical protein [Bryobacterales bacterium]